MPEDLSLMKIGRSCGKVKTELKEAKTPKKMVMKKRRPKRSWMLLMLECHHMRPARMAVAKTWNILRELKDSCLLSLRLLWKRMVNWLNQLILQ